VSVVEWNADLHCLKNGSLHSYEKPELREGCPGACSIGAGVCLESDNTKVKPAEQSQANRQGAVLRVTIRE
jgi:hypothetical protein